MVAEKIDLEPGAILRRARARLGTSLEQASRDTCIAPRYLRALEDGPSLKEFPAPVYAKFFLREYARYLGIDEERLVSLFTARVGPIGPSPPTMLPRKYAVLGPEAIRVCTSISPPREWTPLRAVLEGRRRRPWKRPPSPAPVPLGGVRAPAGPSRRTVGLALLSVVLVASGLALGMRRPDPSPVPARRVVAAAPATLPGGATRIFPDHRVVALYGAPNTTQLGILGLAPRLAAMKLRAQARPYEWRGRPVLPAFELIATVASRHPGTDGLYRNRQRHADIARYHRAARRAEALLLLDVQPGRADFLHEVRALEPFLREPDVGVGLDPEWAVGPDEVPGQVLGSVDAGSVNRVIAYLSGLVARYRLPQKLLVVHQFTHDMIRNRARIRPTPQVEVVFNIDGFGGRAVKISKYQSFATDERFRYGFKLFYEQDEDLLAPLDVANLYPSPDYVVYQ